MGQNLTGNRIADLKLIRKQFGLPLAAAVEVLDEYRKTESRQSGKAV